jgi:hypothetical protein
MPGHESVDNLQPTIWIPAINSHNEESCLRKYLFNTLSDTKKRLPGKLALEDFAIFEENVKKLTDKLDKFIPSTSVKISYLVLGKIQSGKTAHLLSSVAWAADNKISYTTIFTGTNKPLNEQTIKRIRKEFSGEIDGAYIRIMNVPTSAKGAQYETFLNQVIELLEKRLDSENKFGSKMMPVFVSMKNKARLGTLEQMNIDLAAKFGNRLISLIIDDEADLASPNSKLRSSEVSATYEAIAKLRNISTSEDKVIRNILLSYTATPQAVLLSQSDNELRPNHCVSINPRFGYFGLSEIIKPDFAQQIMYANDWDKEIDYSENPPTSLAEAIRTFTITAWIRKYHPNLFYANQFGSQSGQVDKKSKSIQMLIHESAEKIKHKELFDITEKIIGDLCSSFDKILNSSNQLETSAEWRELNEKYLQIIARIPAGQNSDISKTIDFAMIKQMNAILNNRQTLVVNSAHEAEKIGYMGPIPVEADDWSDNVWFVIGGNILGRGLTLPQLTTTYYVRQAKTENYDTISQRMRFCGYRHDYSHMIYLFSPEKTFEMFEIMDEIEQIVWNLGKKWSDENTDIFENIPEVFYVSKVRTNLNATRKNIQDPNLIDTTLGETLFTSYNLSSPQAFRRNIAKIKELVIAESYQKISEEYIAIQFVHQESFTNFLKGWELIESERTKLHNVLGLFDGATNQLGLSAVPAKVAIDTSLLNFDIDNFISADGKDVSEDKLNRKTYSRATNLISADATLINWREEFLDSDDSTKLNFTWPRIDVQHLGGSQRNLKKLIGSEDVVLIIEPLFTHIPNTVKSRIALGIGFTVISPENFEVRIIGLSNQVKEYVGEIS